jgi:hypothetical protein
MPHLEPNYTRYDFLIVIFEIQVTGSLDYLNTLKTSEK